MRTARTALVAGLLLTCSLTLPASGASGAPAGSERAASRSYQTLVQIKKTKVQACVGPTRETGAGLGVPLYIKLNNKQHKAGAWTRITTNLLDSDYYAAGRRNDAGRHAIISPDETVTVKLSSYKKVVDFQISAASIGAC
jgi:hypothetical protein